MSSYAVAFAILGTGLLLAAILWSVPRLKRRRSVRRFRSQLVNLDVVTLGWAQSFREHDQSDEVPDPRPPSRRHRRARPPQPDGGESVSD